MGASNSSSDYVFRYQLQPVPDRDTVYPNRSTEMIRAQLENLLNLIIPVTGGKELKVDGFKLLNDRGTIHELFIKERNNEREPVTGQKAQQSPETSFQDIRNASLYEPRIEFIKGQLENLLSVVELEKDGDAVAVDGFRLKDLRDWIIPSVCDPIEVFGYAGSRCNADCIFCYNQGNPQSLALGVLNRPATEEWQEMITRLKYFSPGAGSGLFPSLGSIYEVLAHPGFLEILSELRQKTPGVFRITTNGNLLTPERIERLASLRPVYLYLSLNSSSPVRRRQLMNDKNPRIAIDSLPLLQKKGVPYATVIVPWPFDSLAEMLADLGNTIRYADSNDSQIIQINLPGYSKYLSTEKLFDLDEVWMSVIGRVRELRGQTLAPIVIIPSLAEENLFEEAKNRSKITGIVRNSPGDRAGLRQGDQILKVNGLIANNRPQAGHLLTILRKSNPESAIITVDRDGHPLELAVNMRDFAYPYAPEIDKNIGIVMMGTGFETGHLEKLREIINGHQARDVLFLSSALMKPIFQQALAGSPLFNNSQLKIHIIIPQNNFFGGNIFMGDLLVVPDFIDCVQGYLEEGGPRPDLIVIPSSPFNLGQWQRDLTGRVYLDIEREVGIPVELLECETVYD